MFFCCNTSSLYIPNGVKTIESSAISGDFVKFVSIPKDFAPETITLEEAEQLIVEKRESEAKKVLRTFDEEPELEVLNGRFGVYIAYKKKNYKIPKGTNVEELTLADCMKIVEDDSNAPKKKVVRRKATTAKKK